MNTLDKIIQSAQNANRHIMLPEGNDDRIMQAAVLLASRGISKVSVIASSETIQNNTSHENIQYIEEHDPSFRKQFAEHFYRARKHKGISLDQAEQALSDPLLLAATMVRAGAADGMVAGAAHPTADVVRSALQVVGMKKTSNIVSSFFLMEHQLPHQGVQGSAIYADCGLVIEPNAAELASIAIDSADSARQLTGIDPKIALLSFSTAGSAKHPNVDKVIAAGEIITNQRPDLQVMPEVQFDAAIMPSVLASKAPDIQVAAPANVFIFPDLQSGNIGYKIAQRIGGVQAIGPILQGLNQPINDLSRGCSVDDIVNLAAVTAVQASHT